LFHRHFVLLPGIFLPVEFFTPFPPPSYNICILIPIPLTSLGVIPFIRLRVTFVTCCSYRRFLHLFTFTIHCNRSPYCTDFLHSTICLPAICSFLFWKYHSIGLPFAYIYRTCLPAAFCFTVFKLPTYLLLQVPPLRYHYCVSTLFPTYCGTPFYLLPPLRFCSLPRTICWNYVYLHAYRATTVLHFIDSVRWSLPLHHRYLPTVRYRYLFRIPSWYHGVHSTMLFGLLITTLSRIHHLRAISYVCDGL